MVMESTTVPSIPDRRASSGYGTFTSDATLGSLSTWWMGMYFGAEYAFTSAGSAAFCSVLPYSVFPTGAANAPAVVVEDMEIPTTSTGFCGCSGGGASLGGGGGGGSSGGGLGISARATLIGGGFAFGCSGSGGGGGGGGGGATSNITSSSGRSSCSESGGRDA